MYGKPAAKLDYARPMAPRPSFGTAFWRTVASAVFWGVVIVGILIGFVWCYCRIFAIP
jgi:hypothetical protein